MGLNINMITPDASKAEKNVHIAKNLKMFEGLGITNRYMNNTELLTEDLTRFDIIYLNWFENIDSGNFYMPILRYIRRKLQLKRIRKAGLKVLFCKHNKFPHNPRYKVLSKNLYGTLCDTADAIVAFNDDADKDLKEIFPNQDFSRKITVIPPISYVGVYPPKQSSKIYEMLAPYRNKLIIGFIGRIVPYKNIELIIRAAKELIDRDIVFFIAGEPASKEYLNVLQQMIVGCNNIIALFERIPDDEMYPVLDVSDLLIMPYDTSSASNSGAGRLAFSYGKTVISPDISSMNRIPEELIYKYHYDLQEDHYGKMMEQIERAYSDWKQQPALLSEKGNRLLELMESEYSEKTILNKYEKLFQTLFENE